MSKINVVYAGNSVVFKGVFLSSISMAEKTKSPLRIHILTMDLQSIDKKYTPISEKQVDVLLKLLKQYNKNNEVILHDITKIFLKYYSGNAKEFNMYTPFTMCRLFIPEINLQTDKIIYLDVDTMLCGDISTLYNIDISKYDYAAVLDHMGKFWIHRNYINAGVIFFNLTRCIENRLFERAREIFKKRKYYFLDQTVLNKAAEKKLIIDSRFNEQRHPKEDTIIKHFCQGIRYIPWKVYNIKQWQFDLVHSFLKIHIFDDIFDIYKEELKKYPFIAE